MRVTVTKKPVKVTTNIHFTDVDLLQLVHVLRRYRCGCMTLIERVWVDQLLTALEGAKG